MRYVATLTLAIEHFVKEVNGRLSIVRSFLTGFFEHIAMLTGAFEHRVILINDLALLRYLSRAMNWKTF